MFENYLVICTDEEIANILSGSGINSTYWDKDLIRLKLEPKDDVVFTLLVAPAMVGIALAWLKEHPFGRVWVPGDGKLRLPWWATSRKISLPIFTVPLIEISYNPKADLRNYLRK
jgi:hypothetical protein